MDKRTAGSRFRCGLTNIEQGKTAARAREELTDVFRLETTSAFVELSKIQGLQQRGKWRYTNACCYADSHIEAEDVLTGGAKGAIDSYTGQVLDWLWHVVVKTTFFRKGCCLS